MDIASILKGKSAALTAPGVKRAFQEMPPVQPAVDPATGQPIDPAAAGGIDPATGQPIDPAMAGGMPPVDPGMDPAMAAAGMAPPPPEDPAAQGGIDPMMPITNLTISDLLALTTQAVMDGLSAQKEEKEKASVSELDDKLNTILSALGLGEGAGEVMPPQGEPIAMAPPSGMAEPMMAGAPPAPAQAMPAQPPMQGAAPMEVQASVKLSPSQDILKTLGLPY